MARLAPRSGAECRAPPQSKLTAARSSLPSARTSIRPIPTQFCGRSPTGRILAKMCISNRIVRGVTRLNPGRNRSIRRCSLTPRSSTRCRLWLCPRGSIWSARKRFGRSWVCPRSRSVPHGTAIRWAIGTRPGISLRGMLSPASGRKTARIRWRGGAAALLRRPLRETSRAPRSRRDRLYGRQRNKQGTVRAQSFRRWHPRFLTVRPITNPRVAEYIWNGWNVRVSRFAGTIVQFTAGAHCVSLRYDICGLWRHHDSAVGAASSPSYHSRALCRQLCRLTRGGPSARRRTQRGVWIVFRRLIDLVRADVADTEIQFHRAIRTVSARANYFRRDGDADDHSDCLRGVAQLDRFSCEPRISHGEYLFRTGDRRCINWCHALGHRPNAPGRDFSRACRRHCVLHRIPADFLFRCFQRSIARDASMVSVWVRRPPQPGCYFSARD